MLHKQGVQILSAILLLAILTSCGVGDAPIYGSGTSGSQASGTAEARLLSISIEPANPAIAQTTIQQFTATGIYSDGTTKDITASVNWSSSDTSIATTDDATLASVGVLLASANKGNGKAYAYGKNAGTTTITATSGDTSASTSLTVTNATLVSLAVTPTNPSIPAGITLPFVATGTFSDNTTQDLTIQAVWSSSITGVATIDSSGLATTVAAGSTTVTAAFSGISGTTTLIVTATTVPAAGSATLAWDAPTTNTDGTPLTNLAGYKIYFGTSSGNYTSVIDVGNVMTYTVSNLSSGTYYFAVRSYDAFGIESGFSNEASKTIQ